MPATPAWPPKSLPRLFVAQPLSEGATVELDAAQANYLGNVLRLGAGAELLCSTAQSGEWLARIAEAGKKRMTLAVERRTREPRDDPRPLARLRAGEARADRLAGREGDRARRGAAAPGDDPADGRRAGEARAAARPSRSRRPSNAGGRGCPRLPSRSTLQAAPRRPRCRRAGSISPTKRGGEPAADSLQAGPGADPDRARRRLHRRGARR